MKRLMNLRKEPVLFALVLFGFGLTAGALAGRIYAITAKEEGVDLILARLWGISETKINYQKLLKECIYRDFLTVGSIVFFATCMFGNWYYMYRIGKRGFLIGLLFGELVGVFGRKGVFVGFAYFFPAWCLYLPVYVIFYQVAYSLWGSFFRTGNETSVFHSLLAVRRRLLLGAGLLVLAGLLEATIGCWVLRFAIRSLLENGL